MCRFIRRLQRLAFSRSCEYALIRWMLLCLALGSFLLLFNEVDTQHSQYIEVKVTGCIVLHIQQLINVISTMHVLLIDT